MNRKTLLYTQTPLILSILLGGISFMLITDAPDYQKFSLATAMTSTLLHFCALGFYLRGLRYFKRELRIAYLQISIGIGLLGIAVGQLSVVNLFNLQFWLDSGAVLIPYIVAIIPLLMGVKRFAKNLGIKSRLLSVPVASGIGAVLGTVAAVLPHAPTSLPEKTLRAGIWLTVVSTFFFATTGYGTRLIRRKAGASFTDSLSWLYTACIVATMGGTQYLFELLLAAGRGWYAQWSLINVTFIISGWLWMRAGYAFSIIGAPDEVMAKHVSSVDIILYVQGLASNSSAIDPVLDGLRHVTSRLGAGQAITPEDQADLLKTYLQVEEYLVTQEPLRKLTRDEIRQDVERKFGISATNGGNTFWPQVTNQVAATPQPAPQQPPQNNPTPIPAS